MYKHLATTEGHPYSIHTDAYRTALSRISRYKLGVYPVLDKQTNKLYFVLMHKSLRILQEVCADYFLPLKDLSNVKRESKGYFVIKITGYHARVWNLTIHGRKNKRGKRWKEY